MLEPAVDLGSLRERVLVVAVPPRECPQPSSGVWPKCPVCLEVWDRALVVPKVGDRLEAGFGQTVGDVVVEGRQIRECLWRGVALNVDRDGDRPREEVLVSRVQPVERGVEDIAGLAIADLGEGLLAAGVDGDWQQRSSTQVRFAARA